MANENMIKFLKGAVSNLPATATPGAVYFTKDEGLYLGLEDGSFHRYGDFIIVNDVASLPASGAHETCAYYCVSENILARFDKSTNTWTQINKQKTLAELGGVAQSAYDEKVSALEKADSDNADAISGVDERLQAAEEKLKSVATTEGLGELTDRVTTAEGEIDALQADSHTHTFADSDVEDAISKKHSHTFADADVVDAISKKHADTFNETELNKIADGDVAKWNAVVADHLTSDDKTTLENSIKEAKKAGTDANTNIETYKVSNDARVLAVEEDIAEITGDNGILAQAKSYTDGKDSAMNTRVAALETAAPTHALKTEVEAVDAKFANYNTTVAQKAIDDAQDAEIAKKVAKTDYEADKATFATKTELQGVDAKFANYKTAADQKLVDDAQDVEIGKKVDKVEGKSLVDDTEIAKLAGVSEGANKVEASTNGKIKIDGVDTTVYVHPDKHTVSEISDFETKIASYDYATKTEAQGYADAKDEAIEAAQKAADDLATYVGTFTASEGVDTVVKYIDAKTANIASDERVSGIENRVKAIEDDYLVEADKTELADLITAEKERAEGIEGGLRTDVDVIKGDYLKTSDKTELEKKITTEESRAKGVEEGLQTQINTIMNNPDTEGVINSINEFTQYITEHGTIAEGMRADIDKNKEDIAELDERTTGYQYTANKEVEIETTHSLHEDPNITFKNSMWLRDQNSGFGLAEFESSDPYTPVAESTFNTFNGGIEIANYRVGEGGQSLRFAHNEISLDMGVANEEEVVEANIRMTCNEGDSLQSEIHLNADYVYINDSPVATADILTDLHYSRWIKYKDRDEANPGDYYIDANGDLHVFITRTGENDDYNTWVTIPGTDSLTDAINETYGYIGNIPEGLEGVDTVVEYVDYKTADIANIKETAENAEDKVKALAGEGNTSTVKKNADDIASLFEQMQWGSF